MAEGENACEEQVTASDVARPRLQYRYSSIRGLPTSPEVFFSSMTISKTLYRISSFLASSF
jgi:hypothetical protein